MKINVNLSNVSSFVSNEEMNSKKPLIEQAYKTLVNKNGAGNDFLGWVNYPECFDKEEFERILKASNKIRNDSDVLVVVGIGGSYLGAKAIISALSPYFSNENEVEVIFAGNSLSSTYLSQLLTYLENKEFSVNVISKSGTTTEPAVAFRLLKDLLVKKYGTKANERIYATTDAKVGALRTMSDQSGFETFVVPDDIGGRYSWFTAVGLLPVCVKGIDINELMHGAKDAMTDALNESFDTNGCMQYALIRNILSNKNKLIEVLVSYEPKLSFIAEWWKQLYGESEGKDNLGIFPSSLIYSTDLHSMGQYIQEGQRIMFETVLNITNPEQDITLLKEENNLDQLNYLAGKTLDGVNKKALLGTVLAHVDGDVPNIMLEVPEVNAYYIGYLLYFFMFSCGVCCYATGVNPFNQPGVESYKKNMFALLEKPGYEQRTKELLKRIK